MTATGDKGRPSRLGLKRHSVSTFIAAGVLCVVGALGTTAAKATENGAPDQEAAPGGDEQEAAAKNLPTASVPWKLDDALSAAASALDGGRATTAILRLEQLADAGAVHPDVSFTRGVAYLRRAQSEAPQPGDMGQAAAAFRETLLLTPNDEFAARGLEEVRIRIARHAATGDEQIIETVGLAQRLLLSLDPWALLILVGAGSLTATVGLLFRRLSTGAARTGGTIAAGLGACVLALSGPLTLASAQLRASTRLAVVVAPRAPLVDEAGRALKGVSPLPEGTELHFEEERGPLLRLSSGTGESWLRRNQVRILQSRSAPDPNPAQQ